MNPEIQDLVRQLDAVKADGRALVAGLSHAQFNWRPRPERWSIAECLHHLNVSVSRTLPALDAAIERGRARGLVGQGPFRYGWLARAVARSMEPPPRWKMKTPAVLAAPRAEHALEPVVAEFLAVRDRLADRVRRADGLDLQRVRVTSPVTRLLRLPLGAYLAFLAAHDRRHLWQARQVRAAPDFGA